MTVQHRKVCHIKMAISDGTRPDMGWRRAPLAAAYAALRQRHGSGSRTGSGSLLFLSWVLCVLCVCCCCYLLQARPKLQGLGLKLELRIKACLTVGLTRPAATGQQRMGDLVFKHRHRRKNSTGQRRSPRRESTTRLVCTQCVD